MIAIGITGSVASGKSTFSRFLAKGQRPLFDADKVVNDFYKKKGHKKKLKELFKFRNSLNIKNKIKKEIIKDREKLKTLEKLIHPFVRKKMLIFIKNNKKSKLIFLEIPLLIESKLLKYFDIIIFVNSTRKKRLKRFISRGGNKFDFAVLDKRQFAAKKKISSSDKVVNNNKSIKFLEKNAKAVLSKYE